MNEVNIKSWLTAVASKLAGIQGVGPERVAASLHIGSLNGVVSKATTLVQGDFSISIYLVGDLDDPSTAGVARVLDSRLRVVGQPETVPRTEIKEVLSLVASQGVRTDDRTVRITSQVGNANVRLTTVHSHMGANIFLRCTRMGGYSIRDLVERGTLSSELAELLISVLRFFPSWTLVVCGPGGSGKSTMMNTLLKTKFQLDYSLMGGVVPSIAVMQGDATDFIIPDYGVPIVSPSDPSDIIAAARTCNTSVIVFGETTTQQTAEIFVESQAATVCAATTTHGSIRAADGFLKGRGTLFVQMFPLQKKIVVSAVVARIERMLGGLKDDMSLLAEYDVLSNRFTITDQGKRALSIAKKLEAEIGS